MQILEQQSVFRLACAPSGVRHGVNRMRCRDSRRLRLWPTHILPDLCTRCTCLYILVRRCACGTPDAQHSATRWSRHSWSRHSVRPVSSAWPCRAVVSAPITTLAFGSSLSDLDFSISASDQAWRLREPRKRTCEHP